MLDFRCRQCNRLLAKIEGSAKVEVKCPRCKTLNLFTEEIYITISATTKVIDEPAERERECTDQTIAEN
ncbi:MAG: Com family DNA-binding transcriptional regulator [Candidatus Margulisbacteria bacterium]|nr:Com family DNA-binding transcriptional regulator [Candidatus Margulisiibacteriota bacterium]